MGRRQARSCGALAKLHGAVRTFTCVVRKWSTACTSACVASAKGTVCCQTARSTDLIAQLCPGVQSRMGLILFHTPGLDKVLRQNVQ